MGNFGDFKKVKTKKPHICVYCGRTIPKGSTARNFSGRWEDDWQNWYTCDFCVKHVEPEYAEPNEEITGDEFMEWFRDSDGFRCKKCENPHYRHHNDHEWVDSTHIKMYCGNCGNEWVVEVPLMFTF